LAHKNMFSFHRCGTLLLDLDNPSKVIARSKGYILLLYEDYESHGDVDNVIFVTGNVKMYYGGADTVMCLAFAKLADLIDSAKNQ